MDRLASPVVRRRQLATQLRRLRLQANLTLEEAAKAIEASAATLSRIENGTRLPGARDVRDLLARYGIDDRAVVSELIDFVAGARESGWWEAYSEVEDDYAIYIGLEAAAAEIQEYQSILVPALLQTERYARSYFRDAINPTRSKPFSSHDIEKRIEVRLRRQKLLDGDAQLEYSLILDAGALARTVGGSDVMREQIDHLCELSERDHIDIRLVPLGHGAHAGQLGAFTILTMPKEVPDVVYVDTLAGELFLESTDDVARHRRAFGAAGAKALPKEESRLLMRQLSP